MDKFIDWISNLPRWVLILISIPVFFLIGFFMLRGFFGDKAHAMEAETANVIIELPEGSQEELKDSKMDSYRDEEMTTRNAGSYWDRLGGTSDSESGLLVSGGGAHGQAAGVQPTEYLDPNEYSELERYFITSGVKTKHEIDMEHAARRAEEAAASSPSRGGSSGYRYPTREEQDSISMARMEMAFKMAAKYSQPQVEAAAAEPQEEEENLRHIDVQGSSAPVEASFIPVDSFEGDGIISSLGDSGADGVVHYRDGVVKAKPIKATFLKNETIAGGQRVILRLMQDLPLSSGVVIPANTHVTGICEIGKRLNIKVTTIHYGGKLFYTDLRIYDNDGTEGIYCPTVAKSGKRKVAGETASQTASAIAAGATTVFTGNPIMGRMASSAISSSTSALRTINSDGSSSVAVASGYEFYILEEIGDGDSKK